VKQTRIVFIFLLATAVIGLSVVPAAAGGRDSDGDGMPNRWERNHGTRVYKADARADYDKDGLRNRAEFRLRVEPLEEDSDSDGMDDGDEVADGYRSTDVDDADTDGDGKLDGDEDADRDGKDNEDEDDARESCRRDDDDSDDDGIADEDEDDFGLDADDADSDDDGMPDGDEDSDGNRVRDEDEDDTRRDLCDGDYDGDGIDDEEAEDMLGVVTSFDSGTWQLVVTRWTGRTITGTLRWGAELEWDNDDCHGSSDASPSDLQPGTGVYEIEFEEGYIDAVALYCPDVSDD
jgi:hypothetical protein